MPIILCLHVLCELFTVRWKARLSLKATLVARATPGIEKNLK